MSVAVSSRVWRHSELSGSSLLILLALADWSDDDGRSYPSIKALAGKARLSERQVQKQLSSICTAGELEVQCGMGPISQGGRSNLYRIRLERYVQAEGVSPAAPLTPPVVDDGGVSLATRRGVIQGRKGVSPVTPNTLEIRQDTLDARAPSYPQVKKPEGVSDQTWTEFRTVLKAKRKTLTSTYLETLEIAGQRAGKTLAEVITICATRQWASFDGAWPGAASLPVTSGVIDLATKGGLDAAAKTLGLVQRADEQRPQFDQRVRQAWANQDEVTA